MSLSRILLRSASTSKALVVALSLAVALPAGVPSEAQAGQSSSSSTAREQQQVQILDRETRTARAGKHDVHCSSAKYGKLCGSKFKAICAKYGGTYESKPNGDADCKGPFTGPSSGN